MQTDTKERPFAIVTGASTGIGYELAKCCADAGFDLLLAADQGQVTAVAEEFRSRGIATQGVVTDLATLSGVEQLWAATGNRPVDALLANAGHGLGGAFLEQDFEDVRHVIETNITGTIYLIQKAGRQMLARHRGRILITGSIAGFMPGSFTAVYNGTKAFIDSFSFALRNELKDSGITVTCLMPGPTETEFFDRAGMTNTKVGQQKKDDPADVARLGFEAMMGGEADVVSGWKNKLQTAVANVLPNEMLAEQHREMLSLKLNHRLQPNANESAAYDTRKKHSSVICGSIAHLISPTKRPARSQASSNDAGGSNGTPGEEKRMTCITT
jgi:short-subunit dehydrogenase